MSGKSNPTIIGIFVVVGLVLGVGTVLLVTASKLFSKTSEYILYFDASLAGLDPGTAVKFRGVPIGSVKEVLIHYNQEPADRSLPVLIEINEDLLRIKSDGSFDPTDERKCGEYIKRGLRGKLEGQSFLTGLLYVNLEFLLGTAEKYHQLRPLHREIPTAPIELQLFQVDFAEMSQRLNAVLGKLDSSLSELQVRELNARLDKLLDSLNSLVDSPDVTNALASANLTLEEMRELSRTVRCKVDQLALSADRTLDDSRKTLGAVRGGVEDLRDIFAPQGELRRDLAASLEDLSDAARSIAELADFLQRHPNAILTGRASEAKR